MEIWIQLTQEKYGEIGFRSKEPKWLVKAKKKNSMYMDMSNILLIYNRYQNDFKRFFILTMKIKFTYFVIITYMLNKIYNTYGL
jgi:hypothetical protein